MLRERHYQNYTANYNTVAKYSYKHKITMREAINHYVKE